MRLFFGMCVLLALGMTSWSQAEEKSPVVVFETSLGKFEVELYQDKAPITVKNFLGYVKDKFYDGTVFHRVIANFMIQGGGFTKDNVEKPTKDPIKNESGNGVLNIKYSIAMARTGELNSATSQFFINAKDNSFLDDGKYCAFGMVISGTETIEKIKAVPVQFGKLTGREKAAPVEPVVILSVKLKE